MRGKFITFILIIAVLVGIVGFWYYQKNIYSKDALKLEILGPGEAQLLEEIEYTVKFKNNGNTTLEDAKLVFEYPHNSIVEQGRSSREEVELEDIYPGEERSYQFKGKLVGKEDEVKKAQATLSYRPKKLKASYESQTTLVTVISAVPLSFELDIPSKTESGRELKFFLNYFSSLPYPLSGLRVKIDYPAGFEFVGSQPTALEEDEWDIGLLNKAEGGRIEVRGTLSAEAQEEKIFRASLGVWQGDEFVLLRQTERGTKITKPLLAVFQHINGVEDYTAKPGGWLHYEIFFRNIGESPFRHLFLISKLEGRAFNFGSLRVESAQFNKDENSIIWDWRDVSELQFLDRGEEGKLEFWIKLRDWEPNIFQEKSSIVRNRVIISEIKEEFSTKVNSELKLTQRGFFADQVFGNEGPLPPEVGEETTYTIRWQVQNCCNDVKDVKVKTTLPPYVKPTGKIFPEDTRLTFDSDSREMIWEVGELQGTPGVLGEGPSCAFQVAITPTPVQKGKKITIVAESQVSGEDQWTEEIIVGTASAVDTDLPDDDAVGEEEGIVQ